MTPKFAVEAMLSLQSPVSVSSQSSSARMLISSHAANVAERSAAGGAPKRARTNRPIPTTTDTYTRSRRLSAYRGTRRASRPPVPGSGIAPGVSITPIFGG